MAEDCLVEFTMSVKSTVANFRVEGMFTALPVANSMKVSFVSRQLGMIQEKWSAPSISEYFAPGMEFTQETPMVYVYDLILVHVHDHGRRRDSLTRVTRVTRVEREDVVQLTAEVARAGRHSLESCQPPGERLVSGLTRHFEGYQSGAAS